MNKPEPSQSTKLRDGFYYVLLGLTLTEDLAGAVRVQGRGGTVLQPGIDLLDNDKSFPRDAPLLIITDGACDHLNLHGRTHAYLLPKGNNLPFSPKGKVFRIQ